MKSSVLLICAITIVANLMVSLPSSHAATHEQYMAQTYKLSADQIQSYTNELHSYKDVLDSLNNLIILSSDLKKAQKAAFMSFSNKVKLIMSEAQYEQWKLVTQNLERFRVISEEKHIPADMVRNIIFIERDWDDQRRVISTESTDQVNKNAQIARLKHLRDSSIIQTLGNDLGFWYVTYRDIEQEAYNNMSRYVISYNNALKIAQIENEFIKKRKEILKTVKLNSERQPLLDACDKSLAEAIKFSLDQETFNKWQYYKSHQLEINLKRNYKLGDNAIKAFKTAYNKFAIEEYNIFYTNKYKQTDEKRSAIDAANKKFCDSVKPLFISENIYKEWEGRWLYTFNKRINDKFKKTSGTQYDVYDVYNLILAPLIEFYEKAVPGFEAPELP